jgi:hypothetical protein
MQTAGFVSYLRAMGIFMVIAICFLAALAFKSP